MPWKPEDARKHTHLAKTPAQQRQWAYVANGVLERTGNEQQAIMDANHVLRTHPSQKKK